MEEPLKSIVNGICSYLTKTQRSLPYNLNVIDELHHANENAHSRILCKLLQYQDVNNQYTILKSFIRFVSLMNSSFGSIEINEPIITQEEKRIDLWIRDKDYAIIIENKVEGAGDQEHQIQRYINKTKDDKYSEYNDNNIYVIYLPADNHLPSDQSWGKYKGGDIENNNFVNLSFQNIIPWLKDEVLPYCPIREDILVSGIRQYIDYLEGFYNLRLSQKDTYHIESNEICKIIGCQEPELFLQVTKTIEEIDILMDPKASCTKDGTETEKELQNLKVAKSVLEVYRNEQIDGFIKRFGDLSKAILSQLYGDIWRDKEYIRRDSDPCFLLYPTAWENAIGTNKVHLEWKNVSVDNLFIINEPSYRIEIHAEGKMDKIQQLKGSLGLTQRIVFSQEVDKPKANLGCMSIEELKAFLTRVYKNEEVRKAIASVNDALQKF